MNLILLSLLVPGILAAGVVFWWTDHNRMQETELHRAVLLMDFASSVREHSDRAVRPATWRGEQVDPIDVPCWATRKVVDVLLAPAEQGDSPTRHEYEGYAIREVALAPMNPENLANHWEAGIIRMFREEQPPSGWSEGQLPLHWEYLDAQDGEEVLGVAEPIVIPHADHHHCLSCHGDRDAAPAGMLDLHPGAAFGWQQGEVVGAQVVYVPPGSASEHHQESLATVLLSLLSVFTLMYLAANQIMGRGLLAPLNAVADRVEAISLGQSVDALDETRPGEFGRIAVAVNRLRRSHDRAIELVRSTGSFRSVERDEK